MRVAAGLLSLAALLATPALAQDKPAAKDTAVIEKCIKAKTGAATGPGKNASALISQPCSKDEGIDDATDSDRLLSTANKRCGTTSSTSLISRCARRSMRSSRRKLREMQRAWIASRDKTCDFLYDYFQGTMANPMIATLREPRYRNAGAVSARLRRRCC